MVTLLCSAGRIHAETHLRVLWTDLDPASREVSVQLLNSSPKTIVAYSLEAREFDASGRQVDSWGIGWDYLAESASNPSRDSQIEPGRTATVSNGVSGKGTSVQVTVTAVVYDDRTAEGRPANVAIVFDQRARVARGLGQALAVLERGYPTTTQETDEAFRKLLDIGSPAVGGALSRQLGLSFLVDREHHPADGTTLSRSEWDEVARDLSRKAAFYKLQAQEVRQ